MLNLEFGDIINLSNSSLHSALPQVAVPNDKHVYVIWHESSGIYGPQRRVSDTEPVQQKKSASILYRVSHDSGSTFKETKELHAFQNVMSFVPNIAISSKTSRVLLAWTDLIYDHEYAVNIFFARGGGGEFERPRRLDENRSGSQAETPKAADGGEKISGPNIRSLINAPSPRLAVSGENVYVLWIGLKDLLAGKHREYGVHDLDLDCNVSFRASHDGGDHFSDAISLGSFRVRGTHPGAGNLASIGPMSLKARNNNVYVIWYQLGAEPWAGSVLFRKSIDGGSSFSDPIALNRMYSSGNVTDTGVNQSRSGDTSVYVCDIEAGEDGENAKDELFASWIVQEQRSDSNLDFFPSRHFNMKHTMYLAKIAGSGDNRNNITFPTYTRITANARMGADSFIRVTGDNVYAFWNDTDTGEITVRSSNDGGYSFGPASGIKGSDPAARNSSTYPVGPFISCQGNRIFAAWHSYLARDDNGSPRVSVKRDGQHEYHLPRTVIVFSASSDNGATFSTPITVSQRDSWRAANVNFGVSKEHVYIACAEGSEWSPDIFFRVGRIMS